MKRRVRTNYIPRPIAVEDYYKLMERLDLFIDPYQDEVSW